MTVSSTIEQKLRGREASTAPADAAMKVLGIEGFCDDAAKSRFSNAVHWAYGTAWGVPRALLDAAGLADTDVRDFRRYGSARQLYNFKIDNVGAY